MTFAASTGYHSSVFMPFLAPKKIPFLSVTLLNVLVFVLQHLLLYDSDSCKDAKLITFTNRVSPELSALYIIKHCCTGTLSLFWFLFGIEIALLISVLQPERDIMLHVQVDTKNGLNNYWQ